MSFDSDLSNLSEKELKDLINTARQILNQRLEEKRQDGIEKIREIADRIGIQVEIIMPSKQKIYGKRKSIIKYKDPHNPHNTWTGKGRIPRWLNAHINQGHSIQLFKISSE
ncbi:H-NS histone family protein [Methylomonas sp. LW13]|uniref:H-NS histone family protein n=1 Tax=unclassified Methylomonas TaxID=2608980 RepID=UPI00051AF7E9|nr:H-NS histone family protein [Methylomonas sp. LW13]QBC28125.1 H-NS histone family protein [Methylomonas sp. LW13]